jgi:nicotinamide riboside kinase
MKSKTIALIGAPACGKTTLSLNLVTQLKVRNKNARYILEYPRDYIERFGHPQHISEQMLIFLNWKRMLEHASEINYEYLICDSPVFITYVYGVMKSDVYDPKDRMWIHELLDMCLETVKLYDKIFYIKPGRNFTIKDNLRLSNKEVQKRIDEKILGFMSLYKIPYETIVNKDLTQSTNEILKRI